MRLAEHILNNFDIPMGFIQPGKGDNAALEYTQWSSIAELTTKRYYVKTYDDQVLRGIDLMSSISTPRRSHPPRSSPIPLRRRSNSTSCNRASARADARRRLRDFSVPSPACGGGTGRGHVKTALRSQAGPKILHACPHPNPPPASGGGSTPSARL